MGLIKPNHKYSYSQLTAFEQCPYNFYLMKIDDAVNEKDLVDNSFAQQGKLIHDLIDKWAKGKLPKEELVEEYIRRYPEEVDNNWPAYLAVKGYADKKRQAGIDYFETFDEFKGYEILDSERYFSMKINGIDFVGIIDMILRNIETGALIILDHKSKSLSTFKKEESKLYRQQYLYSNYIKNEYGCYPDILAFNLFEENGMLIEKDFNEDDFKKVNEWMKETVKTMEDFELPDWLDTRMDQLRKNAEAKGKDPDKVSLDFFCANICSCRNICEECN